MPCPTTPFPRDALPTDFAAQVREAREKLCWSQSRLAAKTGVNRKTISRLESRRTTAGLELVRALMRDKVLGPHLSVIRGWELDEPDRMSRGLLGRAARRASGKSQRVVADASGGSIASLSAFERGLLAPEAFTGCSTRDDYGGVSNRYAKALGFDDADDMEEYLDADDPMPWLARIAAAYGRPLPPAALLPVRRIPDTAYTAELPKFLLD